ncbi:MAG: FHA domain-containing protein [Actinomycetales bacterium]|nr:FHA domain-containing protein [Actinomycetales bacterium]
MIGLSTSDQSEETNFIPAIDADTEELSSADLSVIENLQVGSAMLLVQRGPDAGARFLLDHDSVTVGRHPSSEIFLDDISVSRRHATFVRTEQGYQVSDLGSLNGTYVNRDRIDTDVLLTGGDEVRFGKYRLIYFSGSVSGAGSAQ